MYQLPAMTMRVVVRRRGSEPAGFRWTAIQTRLTAIEATSAITAIFTWVVRSAVRSVALFMDGLLTGGRRMHDDQAFNWRSAPELRNTMRRALGSPMACSDANCVMVRDTVSIVSPR